MNTNKRAYAGIGSRNTPNDILDIMRDLAYYLAKDGWTLRSGGAVGADTAFENGAKMANGLRDIYLVNHSDKICEGIAKKYHPCWNRLTPYMEKLHGRNTLQVLGPNINQYSKFVVCWTPDGCLTHDDRKRVTGGTGTAISIASTYGVPVFNLRNDDHLARVTNYIMENIASASAEEGIEHEN